MIETKGMFEVLFESKGGKGDDIISSTLLYFPWKK